MALHEIKKRLHARGFYLTSAKRDRSTEMVLQLV